MRKIIAVVLTVLMLASVLAVLPVSAAAETTYDGTTKTTEGLNTIFISEVAPYTLYHKSQGGEGNHANALNFMELYNNGAGDVELDSLSILRAVDMFSEPDDSTDIYMQQNGAGDYYWRLWRDKYQFISKIDIKSDKIIDDAVAYQYGVFNDSDGNLANGITNDRNYNFLTNAGVDMTLSNGENAVIWFVNQQTLTWIIECDKTGGFDPRAEFVKSYYGTAADPADYTIVMVWGWSDIDTFAAGGDGSSVLATDMFGLDSSSIPAITEKNKDLIYAVAKNTWDLDSDAAVTTEGSGPNATKVLNSDIYSTTRYGTMFGNTVSQYNGVSSQDTSATFVPANTVPYVVNARNKFMDSSAESVSDFFAAGFVKSYRETGVVDWSGNDITPGSMPDWQWAMIDPDNANAPDSLKTEGAKDDAKVTAAINAYIAKRGYVDDGAASAPEAERPPIEFESQEEIMNRFNNSNKQEEEEDGLETWVLILIIVGGVVVLLGVAAVVVFVVILPKKKKAAAAAAEVAVADVAEVPAEEVPVEEAPAETESQE